ncbi:PH domain-containing protein [Oceanobacillus sp. J11TS1]|uniref:PH domain-containing protein n=1 Tax=Oceanobacillus sp. J11TS1 TaxID=2807191 RepID=UPI001B077EA7|nr:PH domain-containing protein [Oceanobacillus sp. J11TS1]GIO24786.1 membrane protein [Oceanobacillus sp. J11TS1]
MEDEFHYQQNRISKKIITVLRISYSIGYLIIFLVLFSVLLINYYFGWYVWLPIVIYSLFCIALISGIWSILFKPVFFQKHWRYHIDEQYVRLKYGHINETFIIVPMTKIQFVSIAQGPILRKYKLCTINIGTMGSSLSIPGLTKEEGVELSKQIAQFAKIKEVEQ